MRAAVSIALGLSALVLAGCLAPAQPVQPGALLPPLPLPNFGDLVKVGEYGNEPVVRVATDGTIYVGALHFAYVSTDGGATFKQADFKGNIPVYASDSALAVSPAGRAYVSFDWPYAGATAVCSTGDKGATWDCNPTAVPGATDRMWILAPTAEDVYLITGQGLDRPTFAVSHDQGKTWTTTSQDLLTQSQGADLAWDPMRQIIVEGARGPEGNALDPAGLMPGNWGVRAWKPDGSYVGFTPVDLRTNEPTVAVDGAGTWWAIACAAKDGPCNPAVARSADAGKTWNVTPLEFHGKTTQIPFLAAGPANRVAMAWYETAAQSANAADAEWRVVIAQTNDGQRWNATVLTQEPVHKGPMCSSVTCLGENRYAGDFLGLAVDGHGDVHATWVRQTGSKLLPTGQQPPPLPSWERVEYARTRASG